MKSKFTQGWELEWKMRIKIALHLSKPHGFPPFYFSILVSSFLALSSKLLFTLSWIFFFLIVEWFIYFMYFLYLYWSIIALQWCVCFCCTTNWISDMYTYIPHPLPLEPPSHPPYPTSLGGHKAPSWSPCAMQQLSTSHPFYIW